MTVLTHLRYVLLCMLLSFSVFMAGCSGFESKIDERLQAMSAQELFTNGEQSLAKHSWASAIKYFEALQAQYPFGSYLQKAQLQLVYAYYKDRDFPAAQAAADRYLHLYPTSKDNDYVYYLRGLSYFEQDRNIIQRYFRLDLAERDLDASEKAYQDFATLIRNYPKSTYVADARQRMVHLRNLLAKHQLQVAQFYMKRDAYIAAINRANDVVQHYQGTPSVPDSLVVLVTAYSQLDRPDDASKAFALLQKNYPKSQALAKLKQQGKG